MNVDVATKKKKYSLSEVKQQADEAPSRMGGIHSPSSIEGEAGDKE